MRNKMNACRVVTDDGKFDSKRELNRWNELKMLERTGQIKDLQRQVKFQIAGPVVLDGRKRPARHYIADFQYTQNGQLIVEDSKGHRTDTYRLKRHLMKAVHNIEVKET